MASTRSPRVSKNFLAKHTEGLIGFSGCLAGELQQHLMEGNYDLAKKTAGDYETMFGRGNFFLEIQDHGLEPDKPPSSRRCSSSKKTSTSRSSPPTTRTTSKTRTRARTRFCSACRPPPVMNDPKRFKFDTQEFYIKSADEMHALFAENPEVCTRTMQFPERCELELKGQEPVPEVRLPRRHGPRHLLRAGLPRRLAAPPRDRHQAPGRHWQAPQDDRRIRSAPEPRDRHASSR